MTRKLLLLQARTADDPMAAHEHQCFATALQVPPETIDTHSILNGCPSSEKLAHYDGLLIGGSGDFSVTGSDPFLKPFFDFLGHTVIDQAFPTFASCFGFQGLVVAGGGEVVTDADRSEVGTFEVTLTEAGSEDPLTEALTTTFPAQLGHKDRAARLPSQMTHLASSERAPYQAFRLKGTKVFATQFHPELDREANLLRYLRYWDMYGSGTQEDDPVIKSLRDSPEASSLLPRWLKSI